MEKDTQVLVMGVRSRERVACSDESCDREHFNNPAAGRCHYLDGPRTGEPATVIGTEPPIRYGEPDRIVVRTWRGHVLSVDAADVEAVV